MNEAADYRLIDLAMAAYEYRFVFEWQDSHIKQVHCINAMSFFADGQPRFGIVPGWAVDL